MYRRLFTAETIAGDTGSNIDINTFNMKKLHIMAKATFESYTSETPAYLLISTYGKDGTLLYKLKEYVFNPSFLRHGYDPEILMADVIDVEPVSAINIKIYNHYSWESVDFDVEIEWEEKGLC